MSYQDNNTTTVGQLKKVYAKNKTAQNILSSRMDAQVTASADTDADYAAEVVDGRVDAWANVQGSLGTNIRNGQIRLTELLTGMRTTFQVQIDDEVNARIANTLSIAEANEERRADISEEAERRMTDDDLLQRQINELSYAVLALTATISELREIERERIR